MAIVSTTTLPDRVDRCPGDQNPCAVNRVDSLDRHWRCGTTACGQRWLHAGPPPGVVVSDDPGCWA